MKIIPNGALKVWWKPQVPCQSFDVLVETPREAKKLLAVLADYDLFQLQRRIKPDYCNAGGLMQMVDGEWLDWEDDEGRGIDEVDENELEGQ